MVYVWYNNDIEEDIFCLLLLLLSYHTMTIQYKKAISLSSGIVIVVPDYLQYGQRTAGQTQIDDAKFAFLIHRTIHSSMSGFTKVFVKRREQTNYTNSV